MMNGTAVSRHASGPYLRHVASSRLRKRGRIECTEKMSTTHMSASVMPKEMTWPAERAAALTAPVMAPMIRAGQHHAPMSAGTESTSVRIEIHMVLRSLGPPAVSSSWVA